MNAALPTQPGPIGVFDSGYGGLTVLSRLLNRLPGYDYLYLGDNARAPYGTRSFDTVYQYTRQAVEYLFRQGCHLVILACNTASAKALRTIQQRDLPQWDSERRVLGVIRPTAEVVGRLTKSRHVGVLATEGTTLSGSYLMEIAKAAPDVTVVQEACPMWAHLVENFDLASPGTEYFVKQNIDHIFSVDNSIDTLLLGCTHYPLLMDLIRRHVPAGVGIVSQGDYVADSLAGYMERHPEMARHCTTGGSVRYLTTEQGPAFAGNASRFMGRPVEAVQITL